MRKCTICGDTIKGNGHNPSPIKDSGLCCDKCNYTVVCQARLTLAKQEKEQS